ncbi:hypothetical protein TorRG33x02_295450 [Trema orientale]|uniref:Uncharacterized protein n=1 Tax=Trema orientale TaxID=63057 RepID=A0A2P5C715_TREOI|nr:hypothetical protein TorRG33x02_295450 [Trema orientale]
MMLPRQSRVTPTLTTVKLRYVAQQIHSGIEGDIQGTNREALDAPPAEARNGDSDQSQAPKRSLTLRLVTRFGAHLLDSRICSWWRALWGAQEKWPFL